MKRLIATLAAVIAAPLSAAPPQAAPSPTLTNPILPSGPDPWIVAANGTFYFMATRGDRLAIRSTNDLSRLAEATEQVVWRAPASGPNSASIWAPELHQIDGRWFIYYTASDKAQDNDAHRGVWVLENSSADPLQGTWIDRGRVNTQQAGIDGTTFVAGGQRYFAYSPYVGSQSVIALARMSNPWTISSAETIIARPDQTWEQQGGRQILEGPEFLQGPRGDLFLTYSGSACWSDGYAIGLLSAAAGSDPLATTSWSKTLTPVMKSSPSTGVWAPGHNGFFAAGGKTWIIYHGNSAASMGCSSQRAPRVQEVTWSQDGQPVFPIPTAGEAPAPQLP